MPEGSADWLLRLVEGVAVLAFALSGVIEATRRRMDVVGICSVAFVTAFGGDEAPAVDDLNGRVVQTGEIAAFFQVDRKRRALCADFDA